MFYQKTYKEKGGSRPLPPGAGAESQPCLLLADFNPLHASLAKIVLDERTEAQLTTKEATSTGIPCRVVAKTPMRRQR